MIEQLRYSECTAANVINYFYLPATPTLQRLAVYFSVVFNQCLIIWLAILDLQRFINQLRNFQNTLIIFLSQNEATQIQLGLEIAALMMVKSAIFCIMFRSVH